MQGGRDSGFGGRRGAQHSKIISAKELLPPNPSFFALRNPRPRRRRLVRIFFGGFIRCRNVENLWLYRGKNGDKLYVLAEHSEFHPYYLEMFLCLNLKREFHYKEKFFQLRLQRIKLFAKHQNYLVAPIKTSFISHPRIKRKKNRT